MTLSPNPQDNTRPVVLEEPSRPLAPQWRDDAALRPAEGTVADLHPGWAEVLALDEQPLWQGRSQSDARPGLRDALAARPLKTVMIGVVILVVFLNMGLNPALLPMVLVFLFLILRGRILRTRQGARSDRRYLLTNRAAYLARAMGPALQDIEAVPITPTMRLALGPRAVAFTTRRNAKGEVEAEGFLDIPDAQKVHDLIRDLQKALA